MYWQGDFTAALARYDETLTLHRQLGDRYNEADTLFAMSLAASLNEGWDVGERYAEEARSIFDELESRDGLGRVVSAQGYARWRQGDFAGALDLYQEGLAIARETGDQALAITQLVGIAALTFHLGDQTDALRLALEAVDEAARLRNAHIAVWALDLTAAFCASVAPEAAVGLAGAVDCLREKAGGGVLLESLDIEDARSVAAPLLSPEVLGQAWDRGRTMTLEEAIVRAGELVALVARSSTA
jgi:tetratricopeptide (TPR) repeat protein